MLLLYVYIKQYLVGFEFWNILKLKLKDNSILNNFVINLITGK